MPTSSRNSFLIKAHDYIPPVMGFTLNNYNPIGQEIYVANNGCDSTVTIELNFNSQGGNPIVNEISYESNNRYIFSLKKIDEEALVKFTMISKSSKLALRLGELELEDTNSYSDDDINWKNGDKKTSTS